MSTRPWRQRVRRKQLNRKQLMELKQTVQEVQETLANGNHPETPALVNASLIEDLRVAQAQTILHSQRIAQLEAELTAAQNTLSATAVSVPVLVECSIQYDVKAPDMARWRNAGWQVKHYQFVNNDRELPTLAVVMERPVSAAPELPRQDEQAIKPEAPAPSNVPDNFAATQPVDVIFADELDEISIEEEPVIAPEFVPSMAVEGITIEQPEASSRGDTLLKKLAQGKPILSAIMEHGVGAVIDALDAQVYDKAQAAYEAALGEQPQPWRFESKLLSEGNVNPDTITLEENEVIEVMLS